MSKDKNEKPLVGNSKYGKHDDDVHVKPMMNNSKNDEHGPDQNDSRPDDKDRTDGATFNTVGDHAKPSETIKASTAEKNKVDDMLDAEEEHRRQKNKK